MSIDLFDRVIDITLSAADGSSITIKTPRFGPKPSITLSGSFTANIIYDATLQITNLYTPTDLLQRSGQSTYKWITIECGYKNSLMTPITGQIWTAYQDKPSPDGVTTFQFFTGFADEWMTKLVTYSEKAGVPLNTVVSRICKQISTSALAIDIQTYIPDSVVTTAPIEDSGTLSDICLHLGRAYGIAILPEGKTLRVTYSGLKESALSPVHELLFYNDVKKTAATLTVTAPFDPAIRPNDYIRINPKYMSSDLSGMYVNYGSEFMVLNEHFTFGTTDGGNRMVLTTIGQAKSASQGSKEFKPPMIGKFNPI